MNKNDLIQYIREQITSETGWKLYSASAKIEFSGTPFFARFDADESYSEGRIEALKDLAKHFDINLDTE